MQARCLCGSVTISSPEHTEVVACHCGMCQRWGGGPLFTLDFKQGVQIEGQQHIANYRSSDWAERGFCKNCGTHLYYHLLSDNTYAIPAGLFRDAPKLKLVSQIFIDNKPDYYALANQTRVLTEQEVIALFNQPAGDASP